MALYKKPNGDSGGRNTLSVWNSRFIVGYGWDGREFELDSFIESHISDPNISGVEKEELLKNIADNPKYRRFFGKEVMPDKVSVALGGFVKTLVAANSRFDLYLAGGSAGAWHG